MIALHREIGVRGKMSEVRGQIEQMEGDMRIRSAKDLNVYKRAYELAMQVFELSKKFPPEEKFALTSQIRRSSQST